MRGEKILLVTAAVCCFLGPVLPSAALPAFPGAEGCGTETPGGRGGRVMVVTSLADDGPGSLREAVTTPGPRTIVFAVAGEIALKRRLSVTEPFVTIAGQTAPGSGITIRDASFDINTHDVVVRFLRMRCGASLVEKYSAQNSMEIGPECYNVVIDHCSFSWSIDENMGVRGPARDITLSWNIISEALAQPFTRQQIGKERSHSMALIIGGTPDRVSMHHNLLAHCNSRNPRIQGGRHDFVNNVVYDWGFLTGTFSRQPEVNFVGNYYKRGPASRIIKPICEDPQNMGRIYVAGNIGYESQDPALGQWETMVAAAPEGRRAERPFETCPLTITSAEQAYEDVLRHAGAILPLRDAVDRRVVRNVRLGLGGKIDRPEDVGGYPPVDAGTPPRDSDNDGMPDDWEIAHGFDPQDPADANGDANKDGYTNLEAYLEYLAVEARRPRPDVYPLAARSDQTPVEITCNGRPMPVVRSGRAKPIYSTQAWFNDQAQVNVRWDNSLSGPVELLPERHRSQFRAEQNSAQFVVNEAGHRVLQLGSGAEATHLVISFDEFATGTPHPAHKHVMTATEMGVVNGTDVSSTLQAVLDECAAQGGGTVFLHRGRYRASGLHIPSDVVLFLERPALLTHASPDSGEPMIVFDKVQRAGLTGFGTLDSGSTAGKASAADAQAGPCVLIRDAGEIRIEDLTVLDPAGPGIQVINSRRVDLTNLRVIASPMSQVVSADSSESNAMPTMTGGGLAIESSRDVNCRNSLLAGGEKAVWLDSTMRGYNQRLEDIHLSECVLLAGGSGFQVGPMAASPIRQIKLEHSDIIHASHGLRILQVGRGGVEEITVQDVNQRLHRRSEDDASGRGFSVINSGEAPIRNLLFDRLYTNTFQSCRLEGAGKAVIEDVKCWGVRVFPEPDTGVDAAGMMLFTLANVRDAQFRFLFISWPKQRAGWQGIMDADSSKTAIRTEELFEATGGPADLARN